jgi:hypothetical protein
LDVVSRLPGRLGIGIHLHDNPLVTHNISILLCFVAKYLPAQQAQAMYEPPKEGKIDGFEAT